MLKKRIIMHLALFAGLLSGISSCKVKEPEVSNENELITTVKLVFKENGTGTALTYSYTDKDGAGGAAPVIQDVTLAKSKNYTMEVQLWDESKAGSSVNLSTEVQTEGKEHQLFFSGAPTLITVTYNDVDANGKPIGLMNKAVTAGAIGNGNFTVTLRHEPNKSATGVSGGDKTNAGGETDVEVTFPIKITN